MTHILSNDTTAPSINEQRKSKAIVIGGGFGGLATAIRLQAAGQAVTLIEAREHLGGAEPTSLRRMDSPSIWDPA